MILTDRDNTMDYYDCGFSNVMTSNLASVRTTNDFNDFTDIISSNNTSIELSDEYKYKLEEIDFLTYRIDELEKTVEKLKKILETLNIINI